MFCRPPVKMTPQRALMGSCPSLSLRQRQSRALHVVFASQKHGDFLPEWSSRARRQRGTTVVFSSEEGTMIPLERSADDGPFGPLAVLVVGYNGSEFGKFKEMMVMELEADMVKIIPCKVEMLQRSLREALESAPEPHAQMPLRYRKAVIFSGMYPEEITDIITTYGETGLPDCTYCAAVPNNIDRNLAELLEDIHADQSEMERRAAGAATSACSLEPEEEEPQGLFAAAKKFFKL